ncbi:valine--tRNA ligase [Sphingomonas sp. RG327]|uniref:Valine--tRNA ligase n=1 Tax=Sphingomonas anseongensis TaxID=2908207 RepID=A0ABT0RES7_9SPHN|nr:valine--tRNA ligase [Sphingomonas anseongensis]MCL6678779.1 valine--tRNA ligase [Sphingomonas anseongensis]
MSELPKTFDPAAIEQRWYGHWESNGLFRPDRGDRQPWTIVMPPPNVTGSLHIGHALDNTLQDVLTRRERMLGKDALWVVGTDHAGIATQMVVERTIAGQGLKRQDLGREKFLDIVWDWKETSGGAITRQLRRLGASCDWKHERFTMDDGFSKAVVKVFVELHRRGLLYRDKRLVNWDPKFQSAISDLEVETRDVQGKFWTLSYPLEDGSGAIQVATTRPETMLADMAVAVHPDDERYKALVGKKLKHPITGRLIPIVADEHADPELGSGAVKITPGHDFNDFEVGKRAGFAAADMLNMLDSSGNVVQTQDGLIPDELLGLERFEARKRVVEMLEAEGALVSVEDRVIPTPFGDRSGVVIEPWLTDQWYVDAAKLVGPVIEATRSGKIKIVPATWKKTWFNWLENIQPWCVSRQLWWGHRIPAWYADDGEIFVAETEEEARAQAGGKLLRQDDDVLDTWFSSALWPFATLGWPEQTEELKRHYPNDVLISGFDILFFWDARMAMQGIEFMGEVPWRTLYLHGLVRDAQGQKMSKSKGNTVDPLGLIDKYGADALRFTLAAMESQGRDIKLDEKRVEGYRNFATKLWNAARFLQMNGVGASQSIAAPAADLPVNRWIIGEVVETLAKLNRAFDDLRFDDMANAIYHFVWDTYCDWYVELVKGAFDEETKAVAAWAFDQILVMLHPLMPFITEELWSKMGDRPYELIVAKWPQPEAKVDAAAKDEMDWLIALVSEIRSARTELSVPPSAKLRLFAGDASDKVAGRLDRQFATVSRLARLESIQLSPFTGTGAVQVVVEGATYALPLGDVIDLDAERTRLRKSIEAAEKERDQLGARLGNPNFVERAKPEAVEKARSDHAEKSAEAERYRAALTRLG